MVLFIFFSNNNKWNFNRKQNRNYNGLRIAAYELKTFNNNDNNK